MQNRRRQVEGKSVEGQELKHLLEGKEVWKILVLRKGKKSIPEIQCYGRLHTLQEILSLD